MNKPAVNSVNDLLTGPLFSPHARAPILAIEKCCSKANAFYSKVITFTENRQAILLIAVRTRTVAHMFVILTISVNLLINDI